jgi:hypothetical protein
MLYQHNSLCVHVSLFFFSQSKVVDFGDTHRQVLVRSLEGTKKRVCMAGEAVAELAEELTRLMDIMVRSFDRSPEVIQRSRARAPRSQLSRKARARA